MLANYLTTAFRHLCREREYAAINLFGLALGLALCLLVIQLAAYQLSVGDFHEKRDRLYRILVRGEGPHNQRKKYARTSWANPPGASTRSRGNSPLHARSYSAYVQGWPRERNI